MEIIGVFIVCAIIAFAFYNERAKEREEQLANSVKKAETTEAIGNEREEQLANSVKKVETTETIENELEKYVYIDTETSSLEVDRGEVLQLSAVKIKKVNGNQAILSIFNEYLQPSKDIRIDAASKKINGISLAKCKCPKAKAFQEFLEFCEGKIVCGYNLNFDINMINDDMSKEGFNLFGHIKGTKDILQDVYNEMLPVANNKLSTVSKYLGFNCDKYHNAIFDCLATMFVDLQLRYEGEINIDYDRIVNMIPKDNENTYSINEDRCKEFFNGKNVCISGDFENINRKYLEEIIVKCGGLIKSGMSKRVDIFICGYNVSPTNKEKKYDELVGNGWDKITKYNEDELIQKIN